MQSIKPLATLTVAALLSLLILSAPLLAQTADVLKQHNDLALTGQNLWETALTPANVNPAQFGLLYTLNVDAEMYAQPLYVAGMSIPGKGRHNVLFVATQHDSVYALDADGVLPSGDPIVYWHDSFINPPAVNTLPGNGDTHPEIGIMSTPTIDLDSATLYVVIRTRETDAATGAVTYHQKLHALDIQTGAERQFFDKSGKQTSDFPVDITGHVPGLSAGDKDGIVQFDELHENQRASLVLNAGHLYIAWGSHIDWLPYHGWIMEYDARTGIRIGMFMTSPNLAVDYSSDPKHEDHGGEHDGSGIWQSGCAPSIDEKGNVYFTDGNGPFNLLYADYGEAYIKLTAGLKLSDYFVPFNHVQLDDWDADIGTSGVLLLPDSAGSAEHPHLLLGGGKAGEMYLVDRDNMGRNQPTADAVVQVFRDVLNGDGHSSGGGGLFSGAAYFNGNVYFVRVSDGVRQVPIANGQLDLQHAISNRTRIYGFPGSTPSISANGSQDGILWTEECFDPTGGNAPDHAPQRHLILHAYDASDVSKELFSAGLDNPNLVNYVKFTVPTVTNGHVYVDSIGKVLVYGLLHPDEPEDVTKQVSINQSTLTFAGPGGTFTKYINVSNLGSKPIRGPFSILLTNLTPGVSLKLNGSDGTTSYSDQKGVWYANFVADTLPPREAETVTLTFTGAKNVRDVRFTPAVIAGPGPR